MATGSSLSRLGRAVARGSNNPVWNPRAQKMSMHQVTLTHVDSYSGLVSVQFPDPAATTIDSVAYLRPYSGDYPPKVDHVAWGFHFGNDFLIAGQHLVLNNLVIP